MTEVFVEYDVQYMRYRTYTKSILGSQLVCDQSGLAADFADEDPQEVFRKLRFWDNQ